MIKIAVTGGIGCGKSLVGKIMSEQGVRVCEADELAHRVILKGAPAYREIVDRLGDAYLDDNGELDRARLGEAVFSDEATRCMLNSIVHPHVERCWLDWLGATDQNEECAVIVPLLFEAGMGRGWDAVVSVGSSQDVQMSRLHGRGISEKGARERIAAQMSVQEKSYLADYVIFNNGTEELLAEQVTRILNDIRERKHAK